MAGECSVAQWVRPEIRALSAYHVPDAAGLIKLDAMENPYPLPAELEPEWLEVLRGISLNRYPDPAAHRLKQRLREVMEVPERAGLILGNGSDELIQMVAMAVAGPERKLLSVEPGFVMYRMIATAVGMGYAGVPLEADFSLDSAAILEAIERHRPAVVFLAYPNNPTGNLFPRAALAEIIQSAPGLVVIDEAYAPFTDESFLDRVGDHDNLLVMRTVSKMGLAGLRLGLLTGSEDWLTEIDKTRLPYNINVLTQATAEFALRHAEVFAEQAQRIRADRSRLFESLAAIPGVEPFSSEANFILFRVPHGRAGAIHEGLREAGVLIKNLHGAHPLLADCLRVTVGMPEENAAFLAALEKLTGGG